MPVWFDDTWCSSYSSKARIFLEFFLFVGRISLFSCKDRIFFSVLILYVRDSSEYLRTSLFPFLAPQKGITRMYIRTRNIS